MFARARVDLSGSERLSRKLDDRWFGVEPFHLEAGDALIVGGDVFQFLLRQHVGDDL